MSSLLASLKRTIVPVVVIDSILEAVQADDLVAAVRAGGSRCLEITLRTPEAMIAIKTIKKACPDFIVGAGTVLNIEQAQSAIVAGADFLVAPGLTPVLVDFTQTKQRLMIPGVMTPSEAQQAIGLGLQLVKFFPAEQAGGVSMLKALHSVYPDLSIMPTGGINQQNLNQYAALANVFALGGSWVCSADDIADQRYGMITQKLRAANAVLQR